MARSFEPEVDHELEGCYVIHAPEVRRVKIGHAHDPVKRLRTLQIGSPVVLGLVRVFEGGIRKERALHRRFAQQRLHGEWFEDSILPELLAEQDS